MAKEQYKYVEVQIPATPRNKRLTDSIQHAAQTGGVGGGIGYPSTPQYWQLVTVDEEGTALEESQYYLRPISAKNIVAPGDIVAFADGGEYASGLPVADFDTFGLFKAKQSGGLLFDANEGWYVDPEYAGGGIDEEQLSQYLTDNNYITVDYLTKQGYLTLSSLLTGYTIPDAYSPITAKDTILSAIGKLERNFGNYVDLTTNQTIGGVKTFNETVLSKKDVIAYADGGEYASGLPIADFDTFGLFKAKRDGGLLFDSTEGWYVNPDYAGGGIDFTVGTGLDLSAASVLSVKFGTTSNTACRGDDSRLSNDRPNPYSLSWAGYSSGSYDGSSSESFVIPSNTNQLTNGAGFIYDANENIFSLVGSGDSSQYLAGNGRFYTISYSEISGLSDHYVTLDTQQNIRSQKTYTALGWYNGVGLLKVGPSNNVHIQLGSGSGNVINGLTSTESIGNLYFNYQSGTAFTRVDANNNLVTTGDVIAYADGGSYASGLPVADQYTYGLIKYDGTTIGKNSSGQLYVINSGSSGGSTVSWGTENYKVVPLTVNGVSKTVTLSGHTHEWGTAITNKPTWLNSDTKPTYTWSEITSKPSWIGSSKPSYSWSEITGKPTVLSSITYSTSGSGNVVTGVTASGNTVYVSKGSISGGGGDWNGGTVGYNITIQRSSATLKLQYSSNNYWSMYQDSSDYHLQFQCDTGYPMSLQKTGAMYLKGSLTQNSDIRLKTVTGYISGVLDKMLKVNVVSYYMNDDYKKEEQIGYIAQEVLPMWGQNVKEFMQFYTLNYGGMGAIAFQGVKELYTRFLPVENEVTRLKNKIQYLEQKNINITERLDNAYREIFELKQQMGGAA